jgi:hypothetical protein
VYIDGRVANGISCRYDNSSDAFLGGASWSGGGQSYMVLSNLDLGGPGGASAFFYNGDNAPINMRSSTPISYLTVSHCNVHGGPNLIRSHPNGGNHHITIEYCKFYDNASSNSGVHANLFYNEQGHDWTIRYNDISGWQVEGIVLWDVYAGIYYIYGNVFHDPIPGVASGFWPGSNATGNDPQGTVYLYNNTFVNVSITTPQSRSWQFGAGSVSRNNIFWNSTFAGNSTIADSDFNFSNGSTPGSGSIIVGANPFLNSSGQNYHLTSAIAANLPRNKGVSLGAPYNVDLEGNVRGGDGAWDMGAYEYPGVANNNPVISLSPSSLDFGSVNVGASNRLSFTVRNAGGSTLAGTASVSGGLFTIISGGSYSLGSNQSQVVTMQYTPTVPGSQVQTVTFTGGGGTTAQVSGTGIAPPPSGADVFSFEAEAGLVTAPFVVNGTYISQAAEVTTPAAGGRAAYTFAVTNGGNYVVQVLVNVPDQSANSIWLNIDAEPQDPTMIWDMPLTTGVQQETAAWRGAGTFDNNQFVPKIFALGTGTHTLILRGREANCQLDKVWIYKLPPAPANLHVLAGP